LADLRLKSLFRSASLCPEEINPQFHHLFGTTLTRFSQDSRAV